MIDIDTIKAFIRPVADGRPSEKKCTSRSLQIESTASLEQLRELLEDNGIGIKAEKAGDDGCLILILDKCPMNAEHGHGSDVALIWRTGGEVGFECKHSSCAEFSWRDVLLKLAPSSSLGLADSSRKSSKATRSQSTDLVDLANDAELFYTSRGEAWAAVSLGNCSQVYRVDSREFRLYISGQYFLKFRRAASAQAEQDAIRTIEAKAHMEGYEKEVWVRCTEHEGYIYVDLADSERRVVRIGPDGWSVTSDCPVLFWRPRGMKALPEPQPDGRPDELFEFINVSSAQDRILALSWLLGSYHPDGPYPIMALHGTQGSGKSTASRVLRELVDPNMCPIRAKPRDERDLMILAQNSRLIAFDNLSGVNSSFSDSLCRLATGGGFSTRQLFTDTGEILIDVKRSIIVNGIEDLAIRPDLLDRAICIDLDRMSDTSRKTEREFWSDFRGASVRILGCLFDAISASLKNRESTKLDRHPRMADFALWVSAGCEKLGFSSDEFLEAYERNLAEGQLTALEASPVAMAIRDFALQSITWSGTATALLNELNHQLPEGTKQPKDWPTSPRGLSGALKRAIPSLADNGIEAHFGQRTSKGRVIHLVTPSPEIKIEDEADV